MKFQEIFQEEGLYVADSFRDGTAFKISKNSIDNRLELSIVTYSNRNQLFPNETNQVVYDGLFNKEYRKVFTIKSLFSEK